MRDNPFVGTWTYRSLLNDPDVNTDFDKLEFGRGTLVITAPSSDTLGGTIGGPGWSLDLHGSIGYGSRFVDTDRLVGIARFFERGDDDPRTLVEAFADGWWYTAGLPDGRRIVACMTDADLARHMRLSEPHQWCQLLAAIPNVSATVRGMRPCSSIVVRSTASRCLDPATGDDWLAVGDAASRFDPLSSLGIAKALRSGIFASYTIGDWLTRADDAGLRRYRRYVREEFNRYVVTRAKYYGEEQRWPASAFWQRRQRDVQGSTFSRGSLT